MVQFLDLDQIATYVSTREFRNLLRSTLQMMPPSPNKAKAVLPRRPIQQYHPEALDRSIYTTQRSPRKTKHAR